MEPTQISPDDIQDMIQTQQELEIWIVERQERLNAARMSLVLLKTAIEILFVNGHSKKKIVRMFFDLLNLQEDFDD